MCECALIYDTGTHSTRVLRDGMRCVFLSFLQRKIEKKKKLKYLILHNSNINKNEESANAESVLGLDERKANKLDLTVKIYMKKALIRTKLNK